MKNIEGKNFSIEVDALFDEQGGQLIYMRAAYQLVPMLCIVTATSGVRLPRGSGLCRLALSVSAK